MRIKSISKLEKEREYLRLTREERKTLSQDERNDILLGLRLMSESHLDTVLKDLKSLS